MRSQPTIVIGRPLGSAVLYFRNSLWPDPQIVPNDKLPYESRHREAIAHRRAAQDADVRETRERVRVARPRRPVTAGFSSICKAALLNDRSAKVKAVAN